MDFKKNLFVSAENIILLDYIFTDQYLTGSVNDYPKMNRIVIGGESSVKIFEKNNVPQKYQIMFMTYNCFGMQVSSFLNYNKKGDLCPIKIKRFKAREYLTDTVVYLAVNGNDNIFGLMEGENPTFEVHHCNVCDKNDILSFFAELRKDKLLDNYIKSIGEIMHINIKSCLDSNNKKIKCL